MKHLAARQQITYKGSIGGRMPQRKVTDEGKTQRQRFIEAAKELGADDNQQSFRSAIRKIATAPVTKPKKKAKRA